MSLATRLTRVLLSLLSLLLMLLALQEVCRELEDISATRLERKELEPVYFSLLPNTSWTLLDIRRGSQSGLQELAGVSRPLLLPPVAEDQLEPSARNRSTGSSILVYNRVPKCASETMMAVVRRMAARNGFRYRSSSVYWKQVLLPSEETSLVASLEKDRKRGRLLFDRHFYVVDFIRQPVSWEWVNMVRDPVSRLVSQFYYLRQARRWRGRRAPPRAWREKSLEACVLEDDPECRVGAGGQDLQLTYFCGSSLECGQASSRRALQLAKYNVEQRFAVVGVMEELATSLAVLEDRLPRWFEGAAGEGGGGGGHRNRNSYPGPSEETLGVLRHRLRNDLEFYMFVRHRLLLQNATLVSDK